MSEVPQGPGWWPATDGKWYPPEMHPDYVNLDTSPPPTTSVGLGTPDTSASRPQRSDELAVYRGRAPGWYRDSANPDTARYWDGTTLGEERRTTVSTPANAQEAGGQLVSARRPDTHPSSVSPSSASLSARPPTSFARAHRVPSGTFVRRRVLLGGAVVVAVAVVGAAVFLLVNMKASSTTTTVKGTVDVISLGTFALGNPGTSPCEVPSPYGGEMDGKRVVVVNEIGRALGTGTLSKSIVTPDGKGCQFSFTVRGVPNASPRYSVTFGDHMGPVYSLSEMQAAHWTMAVSVMP